MLEGFAAGSDRFRCSTQAVYLRCPNGYHQTKLSNNTLGKMLGGRNDNAKLEDGESALSDEFGVAY